MDQNAAQTNAALGLMVALLDHLKRRGMLTEEDLEDILTTVPSVVRMISPSFNDHKGVVEAVQLVRQTLR